MTEQQNIFRFETHESAELKNLALLITSNAQSQDLVPWSDPLIERSRRESRLQNVSQELNDALASDARFGRPLDWAFCQFRLNQATRPPSLADNPNIDTLLGQDLILFNILVALEWPADAAYLGKLRSAFEQASSLLYDVTDGYMAIGQVVVGGYELMDCADIQIFASNRLFPRSSVNGLNDERKYQPIRLGRGLWNKIRRHTTSWEQSDQHVGDLGPQTLVHEWGHYALGLKDQYLILSRDFVVPTLSPVENTIMADVRISELSGDDNAQTPEPEPTTTGDSVSASIQTDNLEPGRIVPTVLSTKQKTPVLKATVLSTHRSADNNEWKLLSRHPRYRSLQISVNHQPESKAPSLRPIPAFVTINPALSGYPLYLRWQNIAYGTQVMQPEHCWVYIVKGSTIDSPTSLIAQGAIEGQNSPSDLPLLGAELHDFVVLIGNQADSEARIPLVLWAEITENDSTKWKWQPATPEHFPLVDVSVTDIDPQTPPRYTIKIDLQGDGAKWTPWVFPLGLSTGAQTHSVNNLAVLDGHVMLIAYSGDHGYQLAIATYSVGGSPGSSGYPVGPNPLPAGSADGNAMLFFWDDAKKKIDYRVLYPTSIQTDRDQVYERFKIVTVTNPLNDAPPPTGWVPRSYAFSVTSNVAFQDITDLHPTLVLYFDSRIDGDPSQLTVGRYNTGTGRWEIIDIAKATDRDLARHLVALSLNSGTAPGLFEVSPKPEHFRLFLPQTSKDSGA